MKFHTSYSSAVRLAGLLISLALPALSQETYSQWTYSRNLILNTTLSGANINTSQVGFPLLINLTGLHTDIFTHSNAGGTDLRFAKADGTHLPYQIETWDAANQKAEIWVRLDTLLAQSLTQQIRMYWGKESAKDSSDGRTVFRTENGFKGVWHLGSNVLDATANQNHGIDSGTTIASEGRIGMARFFDNPGSYVTNGKFISLGSPANLNFGGKITMEAWVRWNRKDNHRIILCHGGASGSPYETVLRIGETQDYRSGVWTGVERYATMPAPATDSLVWIQLTGVYTGTLWELYRNGIKVSSTALDTNGAKISPAGWRIGGEFISNAVSRYYSGWLDEVRISNVSRSPDWIKANYENQKIEQSLVTIGVTTSSTLLFKPSIGRVRKSNRIPSLFRLGTEAFNAQGRLFN
jgi:trimeric autotransporter adhesin